MTLEQAIARQPAWIGYWLYWLLFGAFALPFALVFWRQSRIAGIAAIAAGIAGISGISVTVHLIPEFQNFSDSALNWCSDWSAGLSPRSRRGDRVILAPR
jgi:hypothetical protein